MFGADPLEGYQVRCTMSLRDQGLPQVRIGSSGEVYEKFSHVGYYDREHLVLVCLSSKLMVTAVHTVSIGSLTASVVHPRELFKVACIANASSIIMIHNHPSGDTTPSDEDNTITERIEECGRVMGIPLVDHLIVGMSDYYSYADAGHLAGQSYQDRGMVMK